MKRFNILLLIFQLSFTFSFSQISNTYEKIINQYKELPTITINEALKIEKSAIFIDTREYNEYKISHIQNALLLGFNKPNWNILDKIPKNKAIIVYCSVGARSQNIGIKLKKRGFKNVRNLYGGFFQWSNEGHKMVDIKNNETKQIHGYSPDWGKWISKGNVTYK